MATDNRLDLFCLVEGESTPFPVKIESANTIGDLKKLIKAKKTPGFNDIDADKLTLWRVSIPLAPLNERKPVFLNEIISATELDPADDLSNVFEPKAPRKIHEPKPPKKIDVVVQRPPQVPKRDREEDAGPSSKRKRLDTYTLKDAIEEAGLTQKAVVDGRSNLSRLNNKERVSLLAFIGQSIDRTNTFNSLSSIALALQGAIIEDMNRLSAPPSRTLPVVETNDLYVREAFKDLYDTILGTFEDGRPYDPDVRKHVVVTGTSGIGKSAFLVYFAIRLLAESDDDNPPMIIFHTKRKEQCFVFGGRSAVRYGNIEDFMPFLSLPDTWYLVDSSPDPVLAQAKTVISASPKTLTSDAQHYQDVDKRVSWRYYMAPWSLEELKTCRGSVAAFEVVPWEMLEELYLEIGGVPRYVLEAPMTVLKLNPRNLEGAKVAALRGIHV
ncbi:hypothetical protein BGZ82_011068 [Podila clonocystis]|nr:hypothetical protein BGZ82_011068 [Podila clonocystis]